MVDVGAHRGFFVAAASRLVPRGRHLAVEPIAELAARLCRLYPQTDVIEAAVAERTGTAEFLVHRREPGLSSLERWRRFDSDDGETVERRTVPIGTLDEHLEGRPAPRLVKIDAMGAQVRALAGARRSLARHRPLVLLYNRLVETDDVASTCNGVWDEIEAAGLRLSLLGDWLTGRPPLDRRRFLSLCGHFEDAEWMFVAHPPRSRGEPSRGR